MFRKRISRALAFTVISSLVMASAAFAQDQFVADGDDAIGIQGVDLGSVCPSGSVTPTDDNVSLWLRANNRSAPPFFLNSVDVSLQATTVPSALSATNTHIQLPGNWETISNGTLSNIATTKVGLLDAGTTEGARSASLVYTASGNGVTQLNPSRQTGAVSLPVNITVNWFVLDDEDELCAPSDTTPPVVTLTPPTPDGNAPWFVTSPVSVDVTATDDSGISSVDCTPVYAVSSSDATSSTGTVSVSAEGETTVSCTATDNNGNTSDPVTATVKIDTVDPNIAVTGFADGDEFILGDALPTVGCDADDDPSPPGSGLASTDGPNATPNLTVNGVGTIEYTCSAEDVAGNMNSDTRTLHIVYGGLSGILQPINSDNSSVFSRGKAVPVKFRLAGDEFTGFNFSAWTLKQQQTSCVIDGEAVGGEVEPVVENPSNGFRYDSTADQYIYNANFKDKAVGTCWKVKVTLDSGQILYSAVFKLQK